MYLSTEVSSREYCSACKAKPKVNVVSYFRHSTAERIALCPTCALRLIEDFGRAMRDAGVGI